MKESLFTNTTTSAKSLYNSNNTASSGTTTNKFSNLSNNFEDKKYSLGVNGHGGRRSASPYHGDLVVDGDGLGIVKINSPVTVTITSEYGETPLEKLNVEVTGREPGSGFRIHY